MLYGPGYSKNMRNRKASNRKTIPAIRKYMKTAWTLIVN